MKIALLASYYPAYLAWFEGQHRLSDLDYRQHQEVLFEDYFGAFISYRNYFRRLGHECELLVDNCFSLQQKWLDEHGVRKKAEPASRHDVVLMQLHELQPDVLFVGSMFDYYGSFLQRVKENITSNIFSWIACPYPKGLDFSPIKCVLTSVRDYLRGITTVPVEELPAAFDANIIEKIGSIPKDIDVSFIGSLSSAHQYRRSALDELLAAGVNVMIFGEVAPKRFYSLFSRDRLRHAAQPALWGMKMYRALARSRITLNFHIDVASNQNMVGNMRMYEATGCGAMLLTDGGEGLESIFMPGKEICIFGSFDELVKNIRYYLINDNERQAVADAGQKACLDRHGYNKRIVEFEKILLDYSN